MTERRDRSPDPQGPRPEGDDGLAGGDPEVEGWLAGASTPVPSPEFRARLRAAFVRGAPESAPLPELPSQAERVARSAHPAMFERSLNTRPIAPEAHPEFREELREAFVSGTLGAPEELIERPRGRMLRLVAPLVAVAAAVLFVLGLDRGAAWSLESVEGTGSVVLGRVEVAAAGAEAFAPYLDDLAAGTRIESGERRLFLELDGELRLQLEPGTTLELGALPEAGPSPTDPLEVRLVAGHFIGTTGPDYSAGGLLVHTPRGDASVVGTTFAFEALEIGCCFCVAEGHVKVRPLDPGGRLSDETLDVRGDDSTFLFTQGGLSRSSITKGGGHLGPAEYAVEHARKLTTFLETHAF